MKKLTKEEFIDRMDAIRRANKIFIDSGLTNNITTAFELYQEVFATRERQLVLTANIEGNSHRTAMDYYERPKCPECRADMKFRALPENAERIKTQLVCSKCDVVLDSDKTLQEWMDILKNG